MKSRFIKWFIVSAIIFLNIGCDQVSKHIVREKVEYNADIKLIDHFLTLTKIENSGAFLSLGDALPSLLKTVFLLILPMVALLYGLVYVLTKRNLSTISLIAICCIIGGGFGNIYDRLLYGSVTDFLHMDFFIFQTGIFNMADVSVMVGMFLLIFNMWMETKSSIA